MSGTRFWQKKDKQEIRAGNLGHHFGDWQLLMLKPRASALASGQRLVRPAMALADASDRRATQSHRRQNGCRTPPPYPAAEPVFALSCPDPWAPFNNSPPPGEWRGGPTPPTLLDPPPPVSVIGPNFLPGLWPTKTFSVAPSTPIR